MSRQNQKLVQTAATRKQHQQDLQIIIIGGTQ